MFFARMFADKIICEKVRDRLMISGDQGQFIELTALVIDDMLLEENTKGLTKIYGAYC
jgi:hypothetical protein